MKYWLGKDKETKIVAITDNAISCGSPSYEKFQAYSLKLINGKIPTELFSIPVAYVKKIEMKDMENTIKIYFGQESCEVITVSKVDKKMEIFEALKNLSPKLIYAQKKVGKFGAAKKPLLALLILSVLFGISYYMAMLIENNELYGDQIALLLAIASLGTKTILKIFGVILTIASISIYKRMSNTYTLHSISRSTL